MEHGLPAVLVEAFTSEPLHGNGAAVVLLEQPASAAWMQRLAGSFKQSETAFLHCSNAGQWRLRWFTPSCEVPLCGHATLAATLALAHWGRLQSGITLQLASRSGALAVGLERELGTIAKGYRADLAVLSGDPLTTPPEALGSLAVDLTLLDGRVVYERA